MQTKICRGPLHPPGGELVSLDNFTFNVSGPRLGKPLSRCKYCRSSGDPKTIPSAVFMPLVEVLFEDRNIKEVVQLIGMKEQLVKDIKDGKRKKIYKHTFLNIKRAVDKLPKEKISIGPQSIKTQRNGMEKLNFEERLALRRLVSEAQKNRYKKDKSLLKHVV